MMKKGIAIIFVFITMFLGSEKMVAQPGSESADTDFKTLLEKGKSYAADYPYHTDSALMILFPLLHAQEGEDKEANRGWVLNIIGLAYDIKGQYDSSAHYLYESLRIAEKVKDDSLQVSVCTNLGILQFEMKNADAAIEYYHRALAIAEKMNHSKAIANLLNNIGNTHMTLSLDFEKAIPYFERCMEVCDKMDYPVGYKTAGSNLVQIYFEIGELDKAQHECNRLIEQYGYDRYLGYLLGNIQYKKGDYRQAIQTYKSLLTVALNSREFEIVILNNIAAMYQLTGSLDSAIVYLEKSYTLKDSLHNQQSEETIHNLQIAYETEKKENEIARQQQVISRQNVHRTLLAAGAGLLLLGLAALFFLWRWTVQKKRFSEQQVKQLEQEKQLIATQAVLDGETQERTRLARDLHDGLGSMITVTKMNVEELKHDALQGKVDVACFNNVIKIIDDSSHELRRVAHHLMPDSLFRFGLKASISDFCTALPNVTFSWYGEDTRLESKLEAMIYRTIHELVNNALKHAHASQIIVQIIQEPSRIAFTVQDDGCGFDPSTVSNGMGLENIRTRVTSFGGIMNIVSSADEGTEINIELNVKS